VGHNPLGSLSVFALLGIAGLQVATGLVADDEIANVGPLNRFVSSHRPPAPPAGTRNGASGCSWRWWRCTSRPSCSTACATGKNLVRPMITGDKPLPSARRPAPTARRSACWRCCAGGVRGRGGWLVQLSP
jgi:hypothetical protein